MDCLSGLIVGIKLPVRGDVMKHAMFEGLTVGVKAFFLLGLGLPGRQCRHDMFLCVRVGEAAHPGPNGSQATARKREEKENAGAEGGASDFGLMAMFRPLIEKLLRDILQEFLKGDAIKGLLQDMLAGVAAKGGEELTSSAQAPDVGNAHGKADKGKGKGKSKQGVENSGGGDTIKGEPKGKIKGKQGAGDSSGHGNVRAEPKSNDKDGKGEGKGSGKPRKEGGSSAEDGSWETVPVRGHWELRAEDWDAPVKTYAEVVDEIGAATAVYKAVLLCNEEQRETCMSILKGTSKQYGVLIVVVKKAEKSEMCPGVLGKKLTFRQVEFTRCFSNGVAPPGAKHQTGACKMEKVASSVVYVRYFQRFMAKSAWESVLAAPQRAFHELIGKYRLKVMDSWGWAKETVQGTPFCKIFGMCRIADKDLLSLLALSGNGAVEGCSHASLLDRVAGATG